MNRFADIDTSFKRLPPIYGYRSEKLVSIEKALELIEPKIDELPYYIKIAKKSCCFPSKHGLSKDQSAAVYIYTMEWGDTTLYRVLNEALRSENRKALKIWFPYLKLFDTALEKLPVVKEVIWRGVSLDIGKNFIKDQMFTWWSINSCSSSVNIIKNFLENDKKSTLFLIEAINGRKVSDYTEFETEDEVILRMGTQFRVKANALDHPNGSHVVHLIETNDDDDDDSEPVASDKNETYSTTKPSNPDVPEIKPSTYISEDVQPKEKADLSKKDTVSNDKDTLKLIVDEIINVLDLDGNEKKDEILKDLLENGQQSLKNYEKYLVPDIYTELTNEENNNNKLIKHLKDYFEQNWKIENCSKQWFIQFLNESKSNENHDLYEQVLIRTAKYGNKFMKTCSILSISLQILFEDITNQYLKERNIFDELWFKITTDGLKSIKNYSQYIVEDIIDEQINKKQSILFQALCEYYREQLFQLLEQSNIKYKQNLYELALDNVTEFGWKVGLEAIQKKLIPINYQTLLEKVDSYLQQQQQQYDKLQKQEQLRYSQEKNEQLKEQIKQNLLEHENELKELRKECEERAVQLTGIRTLWPRFLPDIRLNATWTRNALTVAGGQGEGNSLTQLSRPFGLHVDDDQTLFIADWGNDRILEWRCGATSGKVIAGGNGRGNKIDQLYHPTDVLIDKDTDSLIISDMGNRRVMRWPRKNGTNQETILDNIDCTQLALDDHRFLYVSDCVKHEVRRYQFGNREGTVVAGGNGQGNHLNQLNYPTYIFVDRDQSLYIADTYNHRVMKWIKGAMEGIIVAGGCGKGDDWTQLTSPNGIVVDLLGRIYVADLGNHRVVRWHNGVTQIAGGNNAGEQANQLNRPSGLSFDRYGNLYVIDHLNDRVQRFDIETH